MLAVDGSEFLLGEDGRCQTEPMAYLKPNAFTAKVFNRLAMATGISGTQTLTVTGRTTGSPQQIPVIPVDWEGATYLVCPRGEAQWVRNARVNPAVTLKSKSGSVGYHASEVPVAERGPIIARYRQVAGKTVEAYWKKLPADTDHPVFRLDRVAP
jgi:deazaflavin-dependent oxidoreductase (nitroreductase family)